MQAKEILVIARRVILLAVMASVFVAPLPFMSAGSIFIPTLSTYFPFVVPGMTAAHMLILAAAILHAFDGTLFELPRRNMVAVAMLAVIIIAMLSGVFGAAFMRSSWSTFERMGGIVSLALWSLYAWMLFVSFRGRSAIWPVDALILTAALVGVLAWGEGAATPNVRPLGVFGNQSFTGAFMAVAAVAALGMAAREWAITGYTRGRVVLATVTMYAFTALFLGMTAHLLGSRGAVLALCLGSTVMMVAWLYTVRESKHAPLVILAVSAVGLMAGLALITTLGREGIIDGSMRDRGVVAMVAIEAAGDRPLLGYGPENFGIGYHLHSQPGLMTDGGRRGYDSAHNEIMETLVTRGVLGLIVHAALWIAFGHAVRRALKSDDPEVAMRGVVAAGVLVTHFVVMQFLFFTLAGYITLAVGTSLVLGFAPTRDAEETETRRITGRFVVVARAGAVMFALAMLFVVENVYDASKMIALGLRAEDAGEFAAAVDHYGKAIDLAPAKAGEVGRLVSGVPVHAQRAGLPPGDVSGLALAVLEGGGLAQALLAVPDDWKQNLRTASVYAFASSHPGVDAEALLARAVTYRKAAWTAAPLEMQKLTGQ